MTWRLIHADCLEAMAAMDEASVDAIVCDPPYGLEFMGKEWDGIGRRIGHPLDPSMQITRAEPEKGNPWASEASGYGAPKKNPRCRRCGRMKYDHEPRRCTCDVPDWDTRTAEYARVMQTWHAAWATEALRVLKPGAHLLAFGGTRTYHRLACALEDAGFEIRDTLAWLYGSGFPKSLDVSKAIDKKRDDYEASCVVALWLRPYVERVGFDVVTRAFGFGDETMARARWTSRSQPQVPSWDQWERLRALCGFGDEMDAEVWRLNGRKGTPGEAWDDREVLGFSSDRRGDGTVIGLGHSGELNRATSPEAERWQGWGTALKPAFEPVVLARKPLVGSVATNVERFGTGALNIDGTRIEGAPPDTSGQGFRSGKYAGQIGNGEPTMDGEAWSNPAGRWPANVVLDPEAAAMLDAQTGELTSGANPTRRGPDGQRTAFGEFNGQADANPQRGVDVGGASRFFYCPKADREERDRGLEGFAVKPTASAVGMGQVTAPDWGDPDQIVYERRTEGRNVHPTVKPVELMRWLVKLITPPGGTVLDPFTGSGSTGIAALREGFDFIGIEREEEYCSIARARIQGDAPLFNIPAEVTA